MVFRVLARTPRRIAEQLSEAASAGAMSAAALEATARTGGDPCGAMDAAAEAARMSHRAVLSSAHMFGGGVDRSDVVGIARALQTFAAQLEGAAAALGHVDRRAAQWVALTGIVRDAARAVAAAVDRLDGPAGERDAHLDRADELYDEWRRLVRTARAQVLTSSDDTTQAVAADLALRLLERSAVTCRLAARMVRTVAIKHA